MPSSKTNYIKNTTDSYLCLKRKFNLIFHFTKWLVFEKNINIVFISRFIKTHFGHLRYQDQRFHVTPHWIHCSHVQLHILSLFHFSLRLRSLQLHEIPNRKKIRNTDRFDFYFAFCTDLSFQVQHFEIIFNMKKTSKCILDSTSQVQELWNKIWGVILWKEFSIKNLRMKSWISLMLVLTT